MYPAALVMYRASGYASPTSSAKKSGAIENVISRRHSKSFPARNQRYARAICTDRATVVADNAILFLSFFFIFSFFFKFPFLLPSCRATLGNTVRLINRNRWATKKRSLENNGGVALIQNKDVQRTCRSTEPTCA